MDHKQSPVNRLRMMLSTVFVLAVLVANFVPPAVAQKKYFVLLKPVKGRPYDKVGSYTREDGTQVAVYIPGKKPTSGKSKPSGTKAEPPAPPPEKEKTDHVGKDVYFSSQNTYQQVLAILNSITLAGLQSEVKPDAERYLQNFKANVLALISSVDDFNTIHRCFNSFTQTADTARNDLVTFYDSCKTTSNCKVEGVTRYSNQLNGLMDQFYQCASEVVSG